MVHVDDLTPLSSGLRSAQALEMSVGKIPFVEAVNGSTVMLPCTYSSCIGIHKLYFNWQFNDNGTMQKVSLRVTLMSNQSSRIPHGLSFFSGV